LAHEHEVFERLAAAGAAGAPVLRADETGALGGPLRSDVPGWMRAWMRS